MSKITNTTDQDPMITLLDALSGPPSTAIERIEARGQRELVNASVLPTDGLSPPETWQAMGVVIGSPVDGDPMFTNVKLPAGWRKIATDHSMWSNLVDDNGRVRAQMFYKAAFYDRSAHISAKTRFSVRRDYDRRDALVIRVLDGDAIRFTSTAHPTVGDDGKRLPYEVTDSTEESALAECKSWLASNGYPDFENPAAYWESP